MAPPPSKSDKTLYTGIYLPTFREGTNFIIKLLVSCLGTLTGPGEFCQILRRGRGVPKCILGQTPCSLILRPKGRAETLQLKYSCQLLAVYIQYKHIDYTDIRQIKYKHIHILQIVVTKKVYCVKYKVLDIRC